MTLAQRMIVMNAGRMEQIGTPEEVYHRPATTFVAGFIGSPPMNLLKARRGRAAAPAPSAGIRPEHLDVGDGGWRRCDRDGRDARRRAPDLRPLGGEQIIVRIDEGQPRRVGAPVIRVAARGPAALVRRRQRQADRRHEGWPYPAYPRWIAHRGAGKLAPENTLAAFRLGAAHGYRMFECDVKLSADGVPFLLHDARWSAPPTASARRRPALGPSWRGSTPAAGIRAPTPASRCRPSRTSRASAWPTAAC